MAAVKEWMMRLQDDDEESLAIVMNRLHRNGALWAPRVHPEIVMESAEESFFPDPAYV